MFTHEFWRGLSIKSNRTSMVVFVTPWCRHCQRMAPKYSKAAENLNPLIPFYAIDCDAKLNKRLYTEQGVQGFPTLKVFPRGGQAQPELHNSNECTSGKFIHWASHSVNQPPSIVSRFWWVRTSSNWSERIRNYHLRTEPGTGCGVRFFSYIEPVTGPSVWSMKVRVQT
ncbi:hypothetical protein P692DRAFT_20877299 [Suillus brevipes Sb2]|nr:hypothetical protein P692DRAFT_20877299 [Suillus brevipes Sb2]